jgi:aspartyl-tRNA(Asn)/glutamyl-tRNA(Gln) amidotransferase subunit A
MVAPPLAPLIASDDAFFATNGMLLRNPSAVNFLDGCALSLPCHHRADAGGPDGVEFSDGATTTVLGAAPGDRSALPLAPQRR